MFDTLLKDSAEMVTKYTNEYLAQFPKTQEEAAESFERLKAVFYAEATAAREMWEIYAKAATGDATPNQIADANKKAQELLVTARFATLTFIPGSVFILPHLIKAARDVGVDIVPASVAKEFKI